jgi:hypothetical protein
VSGPEVTLLPCPFCGERASIKASWGYIYIEAKHKKPCGFAHTTGGFGPFGSEKSAIAAWNTRQSATAPLEAQIAALEAQCEALARHLSGLCDAYECLCGDTGRNYHQSAGSKYAHARAALAKIAAMKEQQQ